MNPTFIGRAPHGMEWLAAAEVEQHGARVKRVSHRALWFEFDELPEASLLAGLRTLDDVFLLLGEIGEMPRARSALAQLRNCDFDLEAAAAIVRGFRPVDTQEFTVVASALGKRNYGRYEMESALGGALARRGWQFEDSRLGSAESRRLSVRLHVDAGAFVALRVFHDPLHRRAYRTDLEVAALKPPVAAGMSLLADARANERLHDPFCGVGTIAIEAALAAPGVLAAGSDIDPERIDSARENARRAGCDVEFQVADYGQLGFEPESLGAIVTNPPWDQKVGLVRDERALHWLECLSPALHPEGRCVLLLADPKPIETLAAKLGWAVAVRFQISLFGSYPTVLGLTRAGHEAKFFRDDTALGRSLRKNHAEHAKVEVGSLSS